MSCLSYLLMVHRGVSIKVAHLIKNTPCPCVRELALDGVQCGAKKHSVLQTDVQKQTTLMRRQLSFALCTSPNLDDAHRLGCFRQRLQTQLLQTVSWVEGDDSDCPVREAKGEEAAPLLPRWDCAKTHADHFAV